MLGSGLARSARYMSVLPKTHISSAATPVTVRICAPAPDRLPQSSLEVACEFPSNAREIRGEGVNSALLEVGGTGALVRSPRTRGGEITRSARGGLCGVINREPAGAEVRTTREGRHEEGL